MEAIDALKQKVLSLAIQGKLVPQDPNDEPASVLLEKIKTEKAELVKQGKIKKDKQESYIFRGDDNKYYEKIDSEVRDITDEIPFEIPDSWEWVRVDFLFNCYQPKTISTSALISNGKYLVYGANGIIGRYNEYNHSKSEILLTCRGATCGNVNVSEPFSWINGNAMVIHPYSTEIDRYYIVYMLKIFGKSSVLITGTAQPQIVQNNLNKLLVTLPPLSEQKRIVAEIERVFAQIEIVKKNQEELSKLKDRLKNKILDLAIRGKLVEQDPNDEPASVLLEKIKAEKAELVKQGKIKKDKQESYIYKTPDNRHYEKIGSEVRDITAEIPFEIPNSWTWVRLGNVINIKSGDGLTSNQMCSEGNIPVYGGNGITGYHNKANVYEETIVIGRVGFYCGCVHLTEKTAWVTDNAFVVTYPKQSILREFLILMLTIVNQNKSDNGTAQPVISGKKIYPALIPIPPLHKQHRIIKRLTELMNVIEFL